MHETLNLILPMAAGVWLGAIYFGGLWWTVHKGLTSKHPALLFLLSLLVRMSFALAGLYFISGGLWPRLLMCLIGFIIARIIVISLTKSVQEVHHAT
jgi:F1F0 ATPase subunit 2